MGNKYQAKNMETNNGLPRQAGNGSVGAIVVVIILLLVGALYIWTSREVIAPNDNSATDDTELTEEALVAQEKESLSTEANLSTQSTSDELADIESDLSATSFDSI